MTFAILRKDWALLWPLVMLVTAIQVCWQWSKYTYGLFGVPGDVDRALSALSLAWLGGAAALAAAVVQTDAPPSIDQDWLIRPIPRRDLLVAKLLFVALCIVLPASLLDWCRAIVIGFPPGAALGAAALQALLLYIYLLVPIVALAATVVRMTDLLMLGAALIVVYGVTRSVASSLLGVDACPTCGTGMAWIQHSWQHIEILGGSVLILAIQYMRRTPTLSRAIALVGTVVVVVVQLPWGVAFFLQRHVTVDRDTSGVTMTVGNPMDPTNSFASGPHTVVPVELPLRIEGLTADELLFVNRSEVIARSVAARQIHRQIDSGTLAVLGTQRVAPAAVAAAQTINVSSALYQVMERHPVKVQVRQWLTLMAVISRLSLPARDGEQQSSYVGRCASRLNLDGTEINVRCYRLGAAPICVSATLYGVDQRHNPAVLYCQPDYRPYLPVTEILATFGIDVPIRDPSAAIRYPVNPAELNRSVLVLKFYGAQAHFARLTDIPTAIRLHGDAQ